MLRTAGRGSAAGEAKPDVVRDTVLPSDGGKSIRKLTWFGGNVRDSTSSSRPSEIPVRSSPEKWVEASLEYQRAQ